MDQKQFDALLSDAETRLRRLKVLYEQWFQGIERVEPAQTRKELEDLLAHMRKEQTNNTAQRFRLQQLVQRHVTLSTHWRRVARQIEEGTYQRDLMRAKKRKQTGTQQRDVDEPDVELSYDVEVDAELAAALAEADRLAETPAEPAAPAQSKRGRTQAGLGPHTPPTAAAPVRPALQPDAGPQPSALTPFAVPGADGSRARASNPPASSGPLHKQPLAAAVAGRAAPPPPPTAATGRHIAPPPGQLLGDISPARASHAGPAPGNTGRMPAPPPGAAGAAPGHTGRMPAAPTGGAGATPGSGRMPAAPTGAGATPGTGRMPAVPTGAVATPGTGRMPAAPTGAARSAAGLPPVAATGGAARPPAGLPPGAASAARPAAGLPPVAATGGAARPPAGLPPGAAAARPAAPARPAAAQPQPAASGGGFSNQDVDRVYNQYVAARGRNAERTDNVKRETIEKTIRGMLPQLEQKHAGKKIDFEVVVKDGKVALKPVAK